MAFVFMPVIFLRSIPNLKNLIYKSEDLATFISSKRQRKLPHRDVIHLIA